MGPWVNSGSSATSVQICAARSNRLVRIQPQSLLLDWSTNTESFQTCSISMTASYTCPQFVRQSGELFAYVPPKAAVYMQTEKIVTHTCSDKLQKGWAGLRNLFCLLVDCELLPCKSGLGCDALDCSWLHGGWRGTSIWRRPHAAREGKLKHIYRALPLSTPGILSFKPD
jgi:hypothetical protein